jgi:transcriptional regulator with XRE-family HTH domain
LIPLDALHCLSDSSSFSAVQARGSSIRSKREQMGYGLRRFAAQVGISSSHLSRIERDQSGAQPEVLMRIALGLNVAISDITEETEGKQ